MDTEKKISSESLKRVIIRFDFSGTSATGILPWIENIKRTKLSFFKSYDEAECGSMSLDMSHPERVTIETGIGVKEITRGPLHIFQDGNFHELQDLLKLEISHFYMTLTVNCIDYQDSVPYRSLMCDLMASLLDYDKFVKVNRFGIRKLDLFTFSDRNELSDNLSEKAMDVHLQLEGNGFLGREFIDQYRLDEDNSSQLILMSYRRNLRFISINNELKLQAIIDMDCSLKDDSLIRPDFDQLKIASDNLNNKLYYFFENSLTDKYKATHEKK